MADASFAEFRRQVEYKTAWRGGRVIVADRWFASSKTCSGCGAVKAKLALSERTYVCTSCGMVADRDLNAALNLAEYGKQQLAGSGPETATDVEPAVRPGRPAGGCETSTRHRARGSDRNRPAARRDCGMSAIKHSVATADRMNGHCRGRCAEPVGTRVDGDNTGLPPYGAAIIRVWGPSRSGGRR